MSRPDFLIIGAMKSGTTTLQSQLAAQPGLFMTTPKEPNFFSDDPTYAQGIGWYESLFEAAAPDDLKGEASTHYTKLPTYPDTVERLAAAVPAPRLIYVIRNPLARAVSHYIHEWSQGNMGADPVAAFAKYDEMIAYGCYGMQITPFAQRFGINAILLTSLEQLKADPERELNRIGQHIGAHTSLKWNHAIDVQNVSAKRVRRIPFQRLLIDNPVAEMLRRTLVPKQLRTRIRDARTISHRPELPDALKENLQQYFTKDRETLAALFPAHPALDLCYPFCAS